jgi:hypothetical protein
LINTDKLNDQRQRVTSNFRLQIAKEGLNATIVAGGVLVLFWQLASPITVAQE